MLNDAFYYAWIALAGIFWLPFQGVKGLKTHKSLAFTAQLPTFDS
jgi:hypothetical protein